MANWLKETFSSTASEEDIVKSRSLNITRISGVVLPVLVGVSTAIGESLRSRRSTMLSSKEAIHRPDNPHWNGDCC